MTKVRCVNRNKGAQKIQIRFKKTSSISFIKLEDVIFGKPKAISL